MNGKDFKEWRLKQGWTQAETGNFLGVTVTTISRWESKNYKLPGPVVALIKLHGANHE